MKKHAFRERVDHIWQRVTEGMQFSQLWSQFRKDAHSSYRLYSQEVDSTRVAGVPQSTHFFSVIRQFFWAILEKLTPARRVLLLIALVLVVVPGGERRLHRWFERPRRSGVVADRRTDDREDRRQPGHSDSAFSTSIRAVRSRPLAIFRSGVGQPVPP